MYAPAEWACTLTLFHLFSKNMYSVSVTHPLADVLGLLAQGLGIGDRVVRDRRKQFLLVFA